MQWRTPITLAVLVAILLGAAYYGWQTVVDPTSGAGAPSSSTTTPPGRQVCAKELTYPKGAHIRATSFRVNVYNASPVSGRAAAVLEGLRQTGFRVGVADNPPSGITASNVTILTQSPRSPRVELLRHQFKGVVKLARGPSLALGLDVIVGPQFAGLAPAAPSVLTLAQARTICIEWKAAPPGSS